MDIAEKLKVLHTVVTEYYENYDELLANYLKAGTHIFDLELGIASHVFNEEYHVIAVNPNALGVERDVHFPLKDTYCNQVFKQNKTVCVWEAGKTEPYRSHPVYENMALESYISSPIYVKNQIYGTINFSSRQKRKEPFSIAELELIELMASSIGRFIEYKSLSNSMVKSEKMASLGRLAGGVAHEINNPLAIIMANINLLEKNSNVAPADVEKHAKAIKTAIDRITKITYGLRSYVGSHVNFKKQDVNVFEICFQLFESLMASESDNIKIKFDVDLDLTIHCSEAHLKEILKNLIQNSIYAVRELPDGAITVKAQEERDHVRIDVIDNGSNIPWEVRSKIMDPFFTTKPFGTGPGLGLSISKGLAEQNGGSLKYDDSSELTRFVVEFPRIAG